MKDTSVKWIPLPAGQILGMVKRIAEQNGMTGPIDLEVLLRAKDRYIKIASLLN